MMNTVGKIYTVSFFGHRNLENVLSVENKLKMIIQKLISEKDFVEFLVGRNGDFDKLAASCVKSIKKTYRSDNSALILVLPYSTAEYRDNLLSFEDYFDEIEICPKSENAHFKSAIQIRNKRMIKRSDLIVYYTTETYGGAYQSVCYAKAKGKDVINIAEQ